MLERVFDAAEEMQRQMHAIRLYPRRLGLRLNRRSYSRGYAGNLLARACIDVDRDKKPFPHGRRYEPSMSQRRTMSSEACEA